MLMRLLSDERSWGAGSAVTKIRIKGKAGEKWRKWKMANENEAVLWQWLRLRLRLKLKLPVAAANVSVVVAVVVTFAVAAAAAAATRCGCCDCGGGGGSCKTFAWLCCCFSSFFAATTTTTTATQPRQLALSLLLFVGVTQSQRRCSRRSRRFLHCTAHFPSPSWMQFFTVFSVDCHASMEFQFEFEFEFELQLSVRASEIACWFDCMCECVLSAGRGDKSFFFYIHMRVSSERACVFVCVR